MNGPNIVLSQSGLVQNTKQVKEMVEKGCRSAANVLTRRQLKALPFADVPHECDLSSRGSVHWNKDPVFTSGVFVGIQLLFFCKVEI